MFLGNTVIFRSKEETFTKTLKQLKQETAVRDTKCWEWQSGCPP